MAKQYLVKFNADGERESSLTTVGLSAEEISKKQSEGFELVSLENFNKLLGNVGGEVYIRDPKTGEFVPKPPYVPSLDELKALKKQNAGAEFATRRDVIRWVQVSDGNVYGFDCASEDITNFMAAWKAAEVDGCSGYKVWFTETTKGLVILQEADFTTVFNFVRNSQLEAYAWYESILAQISEASSKEELEAIEW